MPEACTNGANSTNPTKRPKLSLRLGTGFPSNPNHSNNSTTIELIVRPAQTQLCRAAAALVRNHLVDERTGLLTELGRIALEYAFLGTPERAALLAGAIQEARGKAHSDTCHLQSIINLVCF